jgi:hypothetical protein
MVSEILRHCSSVYVLPFWLTAMLENDFVSCACRRG